MNTETALKPHRSDCPGCGSTNTTLFHRIGSTPVNSVLNIRSREEALNFPRGEVALALCRECGFIYNSSFDPDKVHYSSDCEESQGYSPTFNAFAHDLAKNLVEKYGLKSRRIIEIGCGKGEFLKLICGLGGSSGVGFDPAFVPGRGEESNMPEQIEFVADYYSEQYAHYHGDLICCRMTLEHIADTARLVQTVRRSIGDRLNTVVFFQVPDVTRILEHCAFEDIYYEHCSYFSPGSLSRLFRSACFEVMDLQVAYEGQYLLIEAKPSTGKTCMRQGLEDDLPLMRGLVDKFQQKQPAVVRYWETLVQAVHEGAGRAVIWGSGSKGVAFLNALPNSKKIEYAVDINPHRQGTFMAGTGQEIVSPEFLKSYRPSAVIVMNPVYVDEISADLKRMGLAPAIHALGEQRS
jgi:hypothetical protein